MLMLKVVDSLNRGPISHSEMFAVKADTLFTSKDTHFSLRVWDLHADELKQT